MLEELQKDFLAERVRRVNAGNFIKSNTSVEKKMLGNKAKSNVWWNWFK